MMIGGDDKENVDPSGVTTRRRRHATAATDCLPLDKLGLSHDNDRSFAEAFKEVFKDAGLTASQLQEMIAFSVRWRARSGSVQVFNGGDYLGSIGAARLEEEELHARVESAACPRIYITAFEDGPLAFLIARYAQNETWSRTTVVECSDSVRLLGLHALMGDNVQVARGTLVHFGSFHGPDHALLVPLAERGRFKLIICAERTWKTWAACLRHRKLCLGMDLDRTVVDTYTVELLEHLLRSGTLSESERPLVLLDLMALRHFGSCGEVPRFVTILYPNASFTCEGNGGPAAITHQDGGRIVFTKGPDGKAFLMWVRPGWAALRSVVEERYFTSFVTQASQPHAERAIEALGAEHLAFEDTSGVPRMTICRDGVNKIHRKSFGAIGAMATKCWLGLDDLLDGSDECHSNADGVSIWEREDLKAILKPVPYHAYSREAGRSDAIPAEICANLLCCIHQRFFAAVDNVLKASEGSFAKVTEAELPELGSIMSYYGRNNTTSSQAMASFVHSTMRAFHKGGDQT